MSPLIDHPCLWKASSFANGHDEYSMPLDDEVRASLLAAARAGAAVAHEALARPLVELSQAIRRELREGRGFVLIRRLPVEACGLDLTRAASHIIARLVGEPVSQTAAGDRVVDVTDTTGLEPSPRQFKTRQELRLHTDPASDLMALTCIRPAPSGGHSVLASAPAIHNVLLAEAPELLRALFRGFHWHRFGEGRKEDPPYTEARVPVLSLRDGHLACRYVRSPIVAGHRDHGTPLTAEEVAALDAFDRIASSPAMRIDFTMQAGDMLVVNNLAVLHARTRFEDAEAPEQRRLLLRYWLDGGPGFWPKDARIDYFNGGRCGIPEDRSMTPGYDMKSLAADHASGAVADLGIVPR